MREIKILGGRIPFDTALWDFGYNIMVTLSPVSQLWNLTNPIRELPTCLPNRHTKSRYPRPTYPFFTPLAIVNVHSFCFRPSRRGIIPFD